MLHVRGTESDGTTVNDTGCVPTICAGTLAYFLAGSSELLHWFVLPVLVCGILVAVDGQAVDDGESLQALLSGERVGRSIGVQVLRGGMPLALDVTVGQRPGRGR